ncbi:hypothetical protein C0416_01925 [bacterium]|nr:hypothetical protein [bacterium]
MGVNKVRIVATLATRENQAELAKIVQTMSKTALELFAQEQRVPEIPSPRTGRITVSFSLDKATEFKLRKFKNKMGGAIEWNDVIKVLLEKAEAQGGPVVKKIRKGRKVAAQKWLRHATQLPLLYFSFIVLYSPLPFNFNRLWIIVSQGQKPHPLMS